MTMLLRWNMGANNVSLEYCPRTHQSCRGREGGKALFPLYPIAPFVPPDGVHSQAVHSGLAGGPGGLQAYLARLGIEAMVG
jgi:hypothetical protein